jgi:RNA polymerase sigma-B factor
VLAVGYTKLDKTANESRGARVMGIEPQLERFAEYRRTGDHAVRNALVRDHHWIALHCARRFAHRGEPMDDLVQVAQLGLLKAVERFDPSYRVLFATFAMPTVTGELRRHFRDHTWPVRVPRRVQELYLELSACIELLGHELGRPARVDEIAEAMRASIDEVLEAMEAGAAYRSTPLAQPSANDDDGQRAEGAVIGEMDAALEGADARLSVRRIVSELPERERKVVYLRFFEGRTQSEIAAQVGVSQVHISRILRDTLHRLGDRLGVA